MQHLKGLSPTYEIISCETIQPWKRMASRNQLYSILYSIPSCFGTKVINVKPAIKTMMKLLEHRDKNVRESVKAFYIEVFRYVPSL